MIANGTVPSTISSSTVDPDDPPAMTARELMDMCDKWGTDKGTVLHRYDRFYWRYLPPRGMARAVAEIGVHNAASINMWKNLYPHSWVVGMDIRFKEDVIMVERKIALIAGNQANPVALGRLRQSIPANTDGIRPRFDVVVSPGLYHTPTQPSYYIYPSIPIERKTTWLPLLRVSIR